MRRHGRSEFVVECKTQKSPLAQFRCVQRDLGMQCRLALQQTIDVKLFTQDDLKRNQDGESACASDWICLSSRQELLPKTRGSVSRLSVASSG